MSFSGPTAENLTLGPQRNSNERALPLHPSLTHKPSLLFIRFFGFSFSLVPPSSPPSAVSAPSSPPQSYNPSCGLAPCAWWAWSRVMARKQNLPHTHVAPSTSQQKSVLNRQLMPTVSLVRKLWFSLFLCSGGGSGACHSLCTCFRDILFDALCANGDQ